MPAVSWHVRGGLGTFLEQARNPRLLADPSTHLSAHPARDLKDPLLFACQFRGRSVGSAPPGIGHSWHGLAESKASLVCRKLRSRSLKRDATDFASHIRAYVRHNGLCVSRMRRKQRCVSLWGESETQPRGRRIRRCHASCGVSRHAGGTRGYRSPGQFLPHARAASGNDSIPVPRNRCVAARAADGNDLNLRPQAEPRERVPWLP